MKRIVLVLALVIAIFSIANANPLQTNQARQININIVDFSFSPSSISVQAGETITFVITNDGSRTHTFTAVNGEFDSGNIASGSSATVLWTAPSSASTVNFHCAIHTSMTGSITVNASSTDTSSTNTSSNSGTSSTATDTNLTNDTNTSSGNSPTSDITGLPIIANVVVFGLFTIVLIYRFQIHSKNN